MRLSPDEREEWIRERLLQGLVVCGGWLPKSALRVLALGGSSSLASAPEVSAALVDLEAAGLVLSRWVPRFVGRYGAGTLVYAATGAAVCTAPPGEPAQDRGMDPHAAREDSTTPGAA
jgi:hypothetical protein